MVIRKTSNKNSANYWDTTGNWRLNYYDTLRSTPDSKLSKIEKVEKELDIWEFAYLEKLISTKSQTILDIGCGVGRHIIPFATKYPSKKFWGIDISTCQIQLFKGQIETLQLKNIYAIEGNAAKIPLHVDVDLIIACNNSFGVLTGKTRDECFLEIKRLLNDNGVIMISSFSNIKIMKDCYSEWGTNVISFEESIKLAHLEIYDSFWKSSDMLVKEFGKYQFTCIDIKETALGCILIFKNK